MAGGTFWLLVLGVLIARGEGLGGVPAFATFGVIFASIVVEALPFILLGALVSAAMAVWVPDGVFTEHLVGDFQFMGRFLVLGAALSALLQTVVPQTVLSGVAGTFVLGTLALMALAFMLSLCSQADAFVATSFTSFSLGSQLAFLVLGPMADTKLAVLYGATFRRRFVVRLLAVAVPLCVLGSVLFDALSP